MQKLAFLIFVALGLCVTLSAMAVEDQAEPRAAFNEPSPGY